MQRSRHPSCCITLSQVLPFQAHPPHESKSPNLPIHRFTSLTKGWSSTKTLYIQHPVINHIVGNGKSIMTVDVICWFLLPCSNTGGKYFNKTKQTQTTAQQPNNNHNNNQQPTTNNQQPTTNNNNNNNQQPTTNNQQPTTNNQQPTTNNQQPTTNNHPISSIAIILTAKVTPTPIVQHRYCPAIPKVEPMASHCPWCVFLFVAVGEVEEQKKTCEGQILVLKTNWATYPGECYNDIYVYI